MANWDNPATPAHASLGSGAASWLYLTNVGAAVGDSILQAALSLAIWNALYNDVYDVATVGSGFWVSNVSNAAYVSRANDLLDDLKSYQDANGVLPQATWLRTTNSAVNFGQDFIAPVPEPTTWVLFALALAMTLAWHQRSLLRARAVRRSALIAAGLVLGVPSISAAFQPVSMPEPATSALLLVSAGAAIGAACARRLRKRPGARPSDKSRRAF